MPRFSAGGRATIAGTNLLPLASLYATAAVRPQIVEIGLFNTTSTAVAVALQRLTTTGTQGTAISVIPEDQPEQTAVATPKNGHTVGPTITSGVLRQASLGAAVGSGVIWTWPDNHALAIAAATTNGIGITIPTGTGQVLDFSITWIE
jgi:hypothetical protein